MQIKIEIPRNSTVHQKAHIIVESPSLALSMKEGSMRTRIVALLIVGLLLAPGLAAAQSATPAASPAATDSLGCDGLSLYGAAMLTAANTLLTTLKTQGVDPSRDPLTLSSSDWTAFAKAYGDFQVKIKTISPPPFAKEWHEIKIEQAGLRQQAGLTAAASGSFSLIGFKASADSLKAKSQTAYTLASTNCVDFPAFVSKLNAIGQTANAATPTA